MCMADYADGEGGVSLGEATRKARKPHKCGECFRNIAAGETYHLAKFAGDGSIQTYKVCAHCVVAQDWLQKNCGGYLWGGILEDIHEHVEEYRGVYPAVARDLKRLHVHACHHWKFKRGPRAGTMLPIPTTPRFPSDRQAKT